MTIFRLDISIQTSYIALTLGGFVAESNGGFTLKFEHIDSVPCAEFSKKGIRYSKHDFNAKVIVKDDKGKDQEITVCRRAEREWMLGGGAWYFFSDHGGVVFNLDEKILKDKVEELYAFVFKKEKVTV